MRSTSLFDGDETPRGERECGGRLRPSPDWASRGLTGVQGFAPGIDARPRVETRTRLDAQARKPGSAA
jgi:hypothetical protein